MFDQYLENQSVDTPPSGAQELMQAPDASDASPVARGKTAAAPLKSQEHSENQEKQCAGHHPLRACETAMTIFVREVTSGKTVCVGEDLPCHLTIGCVVREALAKLQIGCPTVINNIVSCYQLVADSQDLLICHEKSCLKSAGVQPGQTLRLTTSRTLVGGMAKGKGKSPLIHQTKDEDDNYQRATDDLVQNFRAPTAEEPEWTEGQLCDMSAITMAGLLKETKTGALDLDSKILKHPRRVWDKVLQTAILSAEDKLKIQLLFQASKSYDELAREVDCPRVFNLPKFTILDVIARMRHGSPQYILLTSREADHDDIQLALKTNEANDAFEEDNSPVPPRIDTLWIMGQTNQLTVQDIISKHELGKTINLNKNVQKSEQGFERDSCSAFLLGGDGCEIFFFSHSTTQEDGLLVNFLASESDLLEDHVVPVETALYKHAFLRKSLAFGTSYDGTQLRNSGIVNPQLIETKEGSGQRLIVFTAVSDDCLQCVYFYNVALQRETIRVEGAQAMLYAQPSVQSAAQGSGSEASIIFLADPIKNTYLGKPNLEEKEKEAFDRKEGYPRIRRDVCVDLATTEEQVINLRVDLESEPSFMEDFDADSDAHWMYLDIAMQDMGSRIFSWVIGNRRGFTFLQTGRIYSFEVDEMGQIQQRIKQLGYSWPIAQADGNYSSLISFWQGQVKIIQFDGTVLSARGTYEETLPKLKSDYLRYAAAMQESGQMQVLLLIPNHNEYCFFELNSLLPNQSVAVKPTRIIKPNTLWQLQSVCPVIAYTNKWAPSEVFLVHLNEVRNASESGPKRPQLVRLILSHPILFLRARPRIYDKSECSFRVWHKKGEMLSTTSIVLPDPHKTGAFLKKHKYAYAVRKPFFNLRDGALSGTEEVLAYSINNYLVQDKKEGREFMILRGNGLYSFFSEGGGRKFSKVEPCVVSFEGWNRVYLAVNHVVTQTTHIYELLFDARCEFHGQRIVYNMQENEILAIQADTEQQIQSLDNHLRRNGFAYDTPRTVPRELKLLVFDSGLNLTKLIMSPIMRTFDKISSIKLDNHLLKSMLENLAPYERIIISDRTVQIRSRVFNTENGGCLHAISDEVKSADAREGETHYRSERVEHSTAIAYGKVSNGFQVIQQEPGQRSLFYGCLDLARETLSAHQISEELVLFQLRRQWKLMNVQSAYNMPIPAELAHTLSSEEWTSVKSCIVEGGLTQLALHYGKKVCVLRINAACAMVSKQIYNVREQASSILQNVQGRLLSVIFTEDGEKFSHQQPKGAADAQAEIPLVRIGQVQKPLCQQEVAYLQDFLCYKIQQAQDGQFKMLIYPICDEPAPQTQGREDERQCSILLDGCGEKSDAVTIEACSPMTQLRQMPLDQIDTSVVSDLGNRVQVTIGERTNIHQICRDRAGKIQCRMLSIELDETGDLLDMKSFVDPGLAITHNSTTDKSDDGMEYGMQRLVQTSPFGNLVFFTQRTVHRDLNPERDPGLDTDTMYRPIAGIYRKHSRVDFQKEQLFNKHDKSFDRFALYAQFDSESFFNMMEADLDKTKLILDRLLSKRDDGKIDNVAHRLDLLKLTLKLSEKRFIRDQTVEGGVRPVSVLTPGQTEASIRDTFIKIGRFYESFSYLRDLSSQGYLKKARQNISPTLIEEFNQCFNATMATERIKSLSWPIDLPFLVHSQASALIEAKTYEELLSEYDDRQVGNVSVRMLDMTWFFRNNKNFVSFATLLQDLSNKAYSSELVQFVLDKSWDSTKWFIIKWFMVPHLAYAASALVYMKLALDDVQTLTDSTASYSPFGLFVVLPMWAFQVYQEIKSVFVEGCDYFRRVWNYIDMIGLGCVLAFVLVAATDFQWFSPNTLRTLAALGSCFSLMKILDWLRLFENTAFYVLLVQETLVDVKPFMLLLFTTLTMFGAPLLMLNNSGQEPLIDNTFGFWLLDLLFNQYLLALGEFSTLENFADNEQGKLAYIFFIIATFISQLTILNMLIAVMSDTYERIIENKDVNSTMTKLTIMDDLLAQLPQETSVKEQEVYLFVTMHEADADDDGESWEGSLKRITRVVDRNSRGLDQRLTKLSENLQMTIEDLGKKEQIQNRSLRAHIDQAVRSQSEGVRGQVDLVASRIEKVEKDMQEKMDEVLAAINRLGQ